MSIVTLALRHARDGDPVFPIGRGTKNRPKPDWATGGATVNPANVFDDFAGQPANLGVRTDRLIVVDVDGHREGFETLALHPELPPTYTVRTPNGGLHFYYRAPAGASFSGGVNRLGRGVDVKTGPRNYVVGAGSSFNDKEYMPEGDAAIVEAPAWLCDHLAAARDRSEGAPKVVGELDTPAAIESARSYLEHSAPEAVEGSGGNECTYKVACAVKDRGVSPETALELMLEHWNDRCSPPWEPDDLAEIIAHAFQYGQAPAGRDNPAAGFVPIELPKPEAQRRPALFGQTARRWVGKKPAPIPFVIDRLVPEGLVTLLVSAGGRGKSTLAQQMLSCVASGRPFLGFDVKQGAAAGIFCEDADNTLHNRQLAICRTLKIDLEDIAESISPESYLGAAAVLWTERNGATPLLTEIEAQLRARPDAKLLVVDGVSYVFAANEIDRGQVTRFIAALTALAQRLGIAIVLIHHESKSTADTDTNAASGSTAWINACRSVLKLNDDGGDLRTLKHIKTNLAKRAAPLPCTLASGAFALIHDNAERQEEVRAIARALLGEAIDRGVKLSDKPQARDQWAPRYLAKHGRGQGVTEAEYEAAIKSLADEFNFITEVIRSKPSRRCVRADAATVPPDPDSASAATPPPD